MVFNKEIQSYINEYTEKHIESKEKINSDFIYEFNWIWVRLFDTE